MNRHRVVRILDGKIVDAAINTYGEESLSGGAVWFPEHLKKDGGFPLNRFPDGWMVDKDPQYLTHYALYDYETEHSAKFIRERIQNFQALLDRAREDLLALYSDRKGA